jgi:uncharacterized short protein YbdD (DUF466 family)
MKYKKDYKEYREWMRNHTFGINPMMYDEFVEKMLKRAKEKGV